jgi:hypothetical protein
MMGKLNLEPPNGDRKTWAIDDYQNWDYSLSPGDNHMECYHGKLNLRFFFLVTENPWLRMFPQMTEWSSWSACSDPGQAMVVDGRMVE